MWLLIRVQLKNVFFAFYFTIALAIILTPAFAEVHSDEGKKSDKDIIQQITERPEYTKYLFKNESELTRFSRSFLAQGFDQISNFFKELLSDILRRSTKSMLDTNWLSAVMNFPIWETFFFFLIILLGFLMYKLISKINLRFKPSVEQVQNDSPDNWQSLSRVPDAWQDLIKEILDYYLSSINIVLQKDMSLRYCLALLESNQRSDSFISELIEFLEKWHFSTWQPDEKMIKSWFKSIRDKANYFKTLSLEITHEKII